MTRSFVPCRAILAFIGGRSSRGFGVCVAKKNGGRACLYHAAGGGRPRRALGNRSRRARVLVWRAWGRSAAVVVLNVDLRGAVWLLAVRLVFLVSEHRALCFRRRLLPPPPERDVARGGVRGVNYVLERKVFGRFSGVYRGAACLFFARATQRLAGWLPPAFVYAGCPVGRLYLVDLLYLSDPIVSSPRHQDRTDWWLIVLVWPGLVLVSGQ